VIHEISRRDGLGLAEAFTITGTLQRQNIAVGIEEVRGIDVNLRW
jgi:hypothetical protein